MPQSKGLAEEEQVKNEAQSYCWDSQCSTLLWSYHCNALVCHAFSSAWKNWTESDAEKNKDFFMTMYVCGDYYDLCKCQHLC